MILILDDTFVDRHKYNDVEYLSQEKYKKGCTIYPRLKTTEIQSLIKENSKISFLGYHKSLQLFNNNDQPVNKEENTKFKEVLLNHLSQEDINKVEFSRGLETHFESRKISKDLFYENLKPFLDYYLESGRIEPKILFWGVDYKNLEKLEVVQKALIQIRRFNLDSFKGNALIVGAVDLIYGNGLSDEVIDRWVGKEYSKSMIVSEINEKLKV